MTMALVPAIQVGLTACVAGPLQSTSDYDCGDAGAKTASLIPGLIQALTHKSGTVRQQAVTTLGRIGPAAESAVPMLAAALKGTDAVMRRESARALGGIGSAAEAAVPALIESLEDSDLTVRRNATYALPRIGPAAVPALIGALPTADARLHRRVAKALAMCAKTAPAAFAEAMQNADPDVRLPLALAVSKYGRAPKECVPIFIKALSAVDESVRTKAVRALGRMGPPAKAAVPHLVEELNDRKDVEKRIPVAIALAEISSSLKHALPTFIEALEYDEDFPVDDRTDIVEVLVKMGPAAKETAPLLMKVLKGPTTDYKFYSGEVVAALTVIAPTTEGFIPVLIEMLNCGHSYYLMGCAKTALCQIGLPTLPAVMKAFNGKIDRGRWGAEDVLRAIAKTEKGGIADLIRALKNGNEGVRSCANKALCTIRIGAKDALPILTEALKSEDTEVRTFAAATLKKIRSATAKTP
jgi:HEAT repeat protein